MVRPVAGEKRDSSDEDSDTCPETPVAGRRKRRREWVWTLGADDKMASAAAPEDPLALPHSDGECEQ